ncbi:MAG TPA: hypothetical protein VK363_03360 [Pyrinomonadaceae bacterium]|nr:hypothetical protein [Pyrinomonadaceae bacterium]
MIDLESTKLWKAFHEKASDAQREMVRKLAKRAADRLDLVRDTFPTYTLHNRTHAFNVIERMGDLLGHSLEKITALEGAFMILSAYCHDIGMVFTEAERKAIQHEQSFNRFLNKYPEARIEVEKAHEVSIDVAEWYCRWIHPDRVYGFLKGLPKEESYWGQIPIHEKLGAVCRSHGYDAGELIEDKEFPTNFLGEADLRFCAVMLRLGDILDFDNTRAPEEVYKYLGIAKKATPRTQTSDVEWRKHLAAAGFSFPDDRADGRYELRFSANPDHPAVEYDVRQFLSIIEYEIQKCDSVLKYCSKRWRDFDLPSEINRDDIVSSGYKYGEYRFTLEQNRILELLMGENLYDDPYAFIRELIQNAIDTTRHRVYFERSKGGGDYAPRPITVSTWLDKDNYQWVRVDDYGMGMNEDIIVKYFLKIGESYYQSAQFRAEILGYTKRNQPGFVPISRFGIGVLSCFILGDRVEVATRYIGDGKSDSHSIRLGLSGLHSFYVLQSERDAHYDANEMPCRRPDQQTSYRKAGDFGTSVAVRLDPQKEKTRLDLKQVLEKYVLFSPIPVVFEGEVMGGNTEALIDKPWADGIIEEELTDSEMGQLEAVFKTKFDNKFKFRLVPLDLTKHSPTPNVKGQALLGYLLLDEANAKKIEESKPVRTYRSRENHIETTLTVSLAPDSSQTLTIKARYLDSAVEKELEKEMEILGDKRYKLHAQYSQQLASSKDAEQEIRRIEESIYISEQRMRDARREATIDISRILSKLPASVTDSAEYSLYNGEQWLSHNGVAVPTRLASGAYANQKLLLLSAGYQSSYWLRHSIALSDALRPDVSLSRDRLRNLSWNIYSAIALTFRKALQPYKDENLPFNSSQIFGNIIGKEHFLLGNILTDPLLIIDGEWSKQSIIETKRGHQSLENLHTGLAQGESYEIRNLPYVSAFFHDTYGFNFFTTCAATLVQIGLKARLKFDNDTSAFIIDSMDEPLIRPGQYLFPPLFFLPYENSELLRFGDGPLNQNHPFSEWLIEHSDMINEKYPGIFKSIQNRVSQKFDFVKKEEWEKNVNELNAILERLWELDETLRPEKNLLLKLDDFKKLYSSQW